MNEYLKASSKKYTKLSDKEVLIHPISEIDGEIITEIYEILKKTGINNVADILKEYKYLKDEEIRDKLLQVNIDNATSLTTLSPDIDFTALEGMVIEGVQKYIEESKVLFIDFESKILKIKFLNSAEAYDSSYFNQNTGNTEYRYQIIVNKETSESSTTFYSNLTFSYDLEEDRDNKLLEFKQLLIDSGDVRFIEKYDE